MSPRNPARFTRSFASALAFSGALAACQAGVADTPDGQGGRGQGAGSGFGAEGSGGGFEGTGGGSACVSHCSADLRSFVDCDGNVLVACPDDQGCSPDGTCIAPCDAAEANQSTLGCDFFSATTPVYFGARGGCFAAMVANTWPTPISIGVEYGGETLDASAFTFVPVGQGAGLTYQPLQNGELQPGQLGIVFLSEYQSGDPFQIDCPEAPALEQSTQIPATGRGTAFHITTTAPAVAYDVYPWGGATSYATSATLLLPTPSWGTNFVTDDAWETTSGNPFTQIVAKDDGTNVTIVPPSSVAASGNVPAMPANTATTFTMNRGEIVQLMETSRLAGSLLQSDKPISVWGGSNCMNIPSTLDACDAAHQELLPIQSLGHEYIAARYPTRGGDDNAPYTLVGVVDGTELTFDPPIGGAPATLAKGQMVVFQTTTAFTVKSQSGDFPFYLAAHMTGGATNDQGLGDPEYVNVVPPEQYLSHYLFVTDPTYGHTALVMTRKKDKAGQFHDVTLDCLGVVTGWVPVDAVGETEVARVMTVDGGNNVGSCQNGVRTAFSDAPFGLTVWGYDYYASYAYPAGMSVAPINSVVVPPVPE